jgi:hypothetical protein
LINCTFERKNIFTEFVRRERNEKLSVVSVQIVMNKKFRDDCTYRAVVYKINRREPRTEPIGEHHTEADKQKTENPNLDIERPKLQ